jgi:hypothetical protein
MEVEISAASKSVQMQTHWLVLYETGEKWGSSGGLRLFLISEAWVNLDIPTAEGGRQLDFRPLTAVIARETLAVRDVGGPFSTVGCRLPTSLPKAMPRLSL